MKNLKYLIFFLLFYSLPCIGQEWNNYIINYQRNLYGDGAQTWQIKSYGDRWVYFANQKSMLQYDGTSWKEFPLCNGLDVRSVLPSIDKKRIYVGGINEFGYFSTDFSGKMIYHCMSKQMHGKEGLLGNVWNIYECENTLYLQGDGTILKCVNGKYRYIDLKQKITCSGFINGALYVATDIGISILVGNGFVPLSGSDILRHKLIKNIIPYKNGILVVTAYDGLFYYDGQKMTHLVTGMESFMKRNEVFCAAVSDDQIAVGTVHSGLMLINMRTKSVKFFNENVGMQNNTVLSLSFDGWGNLWAGLDSGIDYILLNSPFTNLYSYPKSYGTGYTALLSGNLLYLGTNRGLYYSHYPITFGGRQPVINSVNNTSGQVWGLKRIGNDIFCLHDKGVFKLEGSSIKRISNITGAWTCQAVLGHPNEVYVGTYDGMYLMQNINGRWTDVCKIKGIQCSCRYFEQESPEELWVCGTTKLIHATLNSQHTAVVKAETYGIEKGLPSQKGFRVNKVNGKIYFTTNSGIYLYNAHYDRIEPAIGMNKRFNGSIPYLCLTEYGNNLICMSPKEICVSDKLNKTYKTSSFIDVPTLELVSGAENIVPVSNKLMIIPNDNGFALFKLPSKHNIRDYKKLLHIRNVYLTYPKDSLIYTDNFLQRKREPEISYRLNDVRFEYDVSMYTNIEGITYQYRLNSNEWSECTTSKVKEYSNLHEGKYTFEVRTTFPNGAISTDSFTFRILPPWYRSAVAYIVYGLLVIALAIGLYYWDDARLRRKRAQAVIEKDREMKVMEKEYEDEKLEYELKHKSQEMANLMINFLRKNEILTDIKSELYKVMDSLKSGKINESKKMLLFVRNKIDSNIQGDDVLKRIEEQFDLVHNNFMKRLREQHPDLSNNERMMCAYLKMELSTKEIAPLLNISIRGVETIRYRLRKKFNLDRDESLTDYIMKI